MKEKGLAILIILGILSCSTPENETEHVHVIIDDSPFEESMDAEKVMGDFEQSLIDQGLVNIQELDPSIIVDLKYSTEDNFFGKDVYEDLTKAYLPQKVALLLSKANTNLQVKYPNLRLLVFDAVRPYRIQTILWDALDSIPPAIRKSYVADPAEGSLHNYGCAVDLSVYDTAADSLLDMGTKYDYFGHLAYPRMEAEMLASGQLNQKQIENRQILREAMSSVGFFPITSEWWHFNITTLAGAKQNYKLIR